MVQLIPVDHDPFDMAGGLAAARGPDADYTRNQPYVREGASGFNTQLPQIDEFAFRDWLQRNKVPFNPDAAGASDYDMRGFYRGLTQGHPRAATAVNPNDQQLHYPDYWKTPYHRTFSSESQWARPVAPQWNSQDQLIAPSGRILFDERRAEGGPVDPSRSYLVGENGPELFRPQEPGEIVPPDRLMLPPRNPAMPADWAQNLVRGVGGKLADIVMSAKRAMDHGMTTEEAIPWGGDLAMTLAGAGAPAAVRGAAGIFGGRLAQTADRAALSRAEELAKAGAPREQIWNDTGWFKGGDDKWRFEIPDKGAALTGQRSRNQTMQQEMVHPELYAAYPKTADIKMYYGARPGGGSYYSVSPNEARGAINVSSAATDPSIHLHELQHAVQEAEGLTRGSSPDGMKSFASDLFRQAGNTPAGQRYRELEAKRSAVGGSLTPAEQDEMMNIYKKNFDMNALQRDAYHRTAGEVEARNVQIRMNMTPEERRAKAPWLTEDVPAEQQIFGSAPPR